MTKLLVIDLDQTIIDSSTRENFCYPDGQLCLEAYHSTKQCPDNGIINDTLLPFGHWLKNNFYSLANKFNIAFLTARLIDYQDLYSFDNLGLTSIFTDFRARIITRLDVIHYGGNHNEQDSGLYKKPVIHALKTYGNYNNVIVIDDCIKVLNMAKEQGYTAICARELYHYSNDDFNALFNSL